MSEDNKKALWNYYYENLSKGIDVGYSSSVELYDPGLAHSLKYDVAKFSAFKETSFRKQLEAALTKDGKIVPWSEFKKQADALHIDYNRRWLKTEYHHTVATANMAQQWQDFQANADLYPNLKYVTAGDGRVRDKHKAYDGLILPINHPFWKTHTTPLDWGCRCLLIQTDEPVSNVIPDVKIKSMFKNNAALTGKVFNEIPYNDVLSQIEGKEAISNGNRYFSNIILKKPIKEQFVEKFKKGRGKVLEHLLIKKSDDYNDIMLAAKEFAKKGKIAELMPIINQKEKSIRALIFPNLRSNSSNPDLKVGKLYYDIKRPKAIKNIVGNANGASKQGAIAVISDSQLDKYLTDKIMQERAKDIFNNENYLFNEVIFIRDGELIVFNRTSV